MGPQSRLWGVVWLTILLISLGRLPPCRAAAAERCEEATTTHSQWVVIVSSSDHWFNYRHTANALVVYELVRSFGVDPSRILLLLGDETLACDARNPFPGVVLRSPHKQSVSYRSETDSSAAHNMWTREVSEAVDYCGTGVSVETLRALLEGDIQPKEGPFGFLPRLRSDENSSVLLYMVGHGYPGHFQFHQSEFISALQFRQTIELMWRRGRYGKLLVLIDSCQAITLCEGVVSPNVACLASSSAKDFGLSSFIDRRVGLHTTSDWIENMRMVFTGATCESPHGVLRQSLSSVGMQLHPDPEAMRSVGDCLETWTWADFVCPKQQSSVAVPLRERLPEVSWDSFLQ